MDFLHNILIRLFLGSFKASEAGPSRTNWTAHFVAMGFSEDLVAKAIEQNSQCSFLFADSTFYGLNSLLAYHINCFVDRRRRRYR